MNTDLQKKPLRGLFEPAYFTLPNVDKIICDFLKKTILERQDGQIVAMLAFFHQPYCNKDNDGIFYRWFTWNRKLKLKEDILSQFQYKNEKEGIAFNCSHRTNTLAANFLKIFADELEKSRPNSIRELKLKKKKNKNKNKINRTSKISSLNNSRMWLIENPSMYVGFTEPLQNTTTEWSLYYPIFVSNRLAGLFAIDGESSHISRKLKEEKNERQKLLASLSLLELSIGCIFKAYYTQLEHPPCSATLTSSYWNRSEETYIFTPAFLAELLSTYMYNGRNSRYNATLPTAELISYWDANGVKSINDTLGSHPTGNEIVRSVGRWLHDGFREILREANILEKSYFWVIRWGGDEFIVILVANPTLTSKEKNKIKDMLGKLPNCQVGNIINKQLQSVVGEITEKSWRNGLRIKKTSAEIEKVLKLVGISGGYSWCKDNTRDAYENALAEAEKAMYIAKFLMKNKDMKGSHGICYRFSEETEEYMKRKCEENKFYDCLALSNNLSNQTMVFK